MGFFNFAMVKGFFLRRMERSDIDRVLEIEKESFQVPWSRKLFLDEFDRGYSYNYAVCDREKGDIQGFIIFWVLFEECHILNISVAEGMRRRGLGKWLIMQCEEIAKREGASYLYLEVREGNEPAKNLYRKLGFRFIGIRRGYYDDTGEDGWVMMKSIKKGDS